MRGTNKRKKGRRVEGREEGSNRGRVWRRKRERRRERGRKEGGLSDGHVWMTGLTAVVENKWKQLCKSGLRKWESCYDLSPGISSVKTMPGNLVALTLKLTLSLHCQLCSLHHAEDVGTSAQAWATSCVIPRYYCFTLLYCELQFYLFSTPRNFEWYFFSSVHLLYQFN